MEFRKLCNPPKACILVHKGPFAWFFSQHVVKFYFIAILPVNGILSKPSWVKLESDERPELVLWKSSHLDATFSDFVFKILPDKAQAQAQINNEQYARQNWDEGAQIYLTSETSIPELDGKPLMKTQSRTSKKSSPIEGIIYNVIRKLKVERQYAINSWSDRRVHKWNTKLLHAGSSGLCHLYFYGSIVPRTKLRLICAADESKFIILLLVIILNLSHKESEIGGFPT